MRKTRSSALDATGEQVSCGQGFIEFWQPQTKRSALASLLSEKGPGPFGFSVTVASLETAQEIVQEGFRTKLAIDNGTDQRGLLVSGGLTGVWVEFIQ
ncbi:MAG TPA: hypothetical protein VH157_02385 [Bryobacteraceae bacterium]|nr:hypothetical protein [Bryobacteraceae bacterium]